LDRKGGGKQSFHGSMLGEKVRGGTLREAPLLFKSISGRGEGITTLFRSNLSKLEGQGSNYTKLHDPYLGTRGDGKRH